MGLYCEIKGKIESLTLVGHLPQETSQFSKYFLEYNGELDVTVRSSGPGLEKENLAWRFSER